MTTFVHDLMQWIDHMERTQWLLVLAGAILIGILCMRGIGARSHF